MVPTPNSTKLRIISSWRQWQFSISSLFFLLVHLILAESSPRWNQWEKCQRMMLWQKKTQYKIQYKYSCSMYNIRIYLWGCGKRDEVQTPKNFTRLLLVFWRLTARPQTANHSPAPINSGGLVLLRSWDQGRTETRSEQYRKYVTIKNLGQRSCLLVKTLVSQVAPLWSPESVCLSAPTARDRQQQGVSATKKQHNKQDLAKVPWPYSVPGPSILVS